jgi:hypothetical protein
MRAREVREIMQQGSSQVSKQDPIAKILEVQAEDQHDIKKNLHAVASMVDTLIDTVDALVNVTANPDMMAAMAQIAKRKAGDQLAAANKTEGLDVPE